MKRRRRVDPAKFFRTLLLGYFCRPVHAGVQSSDRRRCRLAAIRAEETRQHRVCAANLPVDGIPAAGIGALYRGRRAVEPAFKRWKSAFLSAATPGRKRLIVEAKIHASVLPLMAGKRRFVATREKLRRERRRLNACRRTRSMHTFADHLPRLVNCASRRAGDIERRLEPPLLVAILGPHLRRPGLRARARNALTCPTARAPGKATS
ncbi:MAG: transposase [Planctomycetes bacterium]|nr:transposase [Planctomycetota bacterium]